MTTAPREWVRVLTEQLGDRDDLHPATGPELELEGTWAESGERRGLQSLGSPWERGAVTGQIES